MTQMTYAPKKTVARARDLRRTMTLPEVLLWQHIRGRQLTGIRFRRQHPIGPYILDFFCEDARLAVEVDGESHCQAEAVEHDKRRTEWLNARGISVLRIPARDVLSELAAVVDHIQRQVRDQPPPPLRGPPPPVGED
jgi:very-short-patch-repair endonuclease